MKLDRRDPVLLAEAHRSSVPYANTQSAYAIHSEGLGERALKDLGHGALQVLGDATHYMGESSGASYLSQAGSWLQFGAERLDVANPGFADQFGRALGGVAATVLVARGAGSATLVGSGAIERERSSTFYGTSNPQLTKENLILIDNLQRHLRSFGDSSLSEELSLGADNPPSNLLQKYAVKWGDINEASFFLGKTQLSGNMSLADFYKTAREYAEGGSGATTYHRLDSWYANTSQESRQRFDALIARGYIRPIEIWKMLHDDYVATVQHLNDMRSHSN